MQCRLTVLYAQMSVQINHVKSIFHLQNVF